MSSKPGLDKHEDHVFLPRKRKVAYGVGGIAFMILANATNQMSGIYTVIFKVSPMLVGAIFLFPRLWDAITDPIMGNLSDNTRSRWGRRRPYVLLGGVIAALLVIAMTCPPGSWTGFLNDHYKVLTAAADANGTPINNLDAAGEHLTGIIAGAPVIEPPEDTGAEPEGGFFAKLVEQVPSVEIQEGQLKSDIATLNMSYNALSKLEPGERLLKVMTAIVGLDDETVKPAIADRRTF